MKKLSSKVLAVSALAALMFSMGANAADVPKGTKLAKVQLLNMANTDNPVSLDPSILTDSVSGVVVNNLFSTLVRVDPNNNIIPELAESWTHNKDATVWTFKLRDAKWSNGEPITAYDFEYSWKRLIDPKTAAEYAFYLEEIGVVNAHEIIKGEVSVDKAGFKALNAKTFEIRLKNPTPFLAITLAHVNLAALPKKTIEKYGQAWTNPDNIVTSGAYTLKEYVVNSHTRLLKNEKYWNKDKVVVNEAYIYVIKNENDAYKRFLARDIHVSKLAAIYFDKAKKLKDAKLFNSDSIRGTWLDFNTTLPKLSDVRVREALSIAIDRREIVSKVFRSGDIPTGLIVPNTINEAEEIKQPAWFNESMSSRIARAKKLLASAGYSAKNPLEITIDYNTAEVYKKLFIAIQNQYQKAFGKAVKVTIYNMEWKTILQKRRQKDYEIVRSGWGADYDNATNFLNIYKSGSAFNNTGFSSPKYDALLEKLSVTIDAKERAKIFQSLHDTLGESYAVAPIYSNVETYILTKNLQGWGRNNTNRYFQDLYFTEK